MKQQQMAVTFIFCGVSQKLCSSKEGSMTKLHQHLVSQEHSFHDPHRTQLQSAVSLLPYLSFTCSSVTMLIGHLWVRCLLDVCATGHSQRWANKAHGKVQSAVYIVMPSIELAPSPCWEGELLAPTLSSSSLLLNYRGLVAKPHSNLLLPTWQPNWFQLPSRYMYVNWWRGNILI